MVPCRVTSAEIRHLQEEALGRYPGLLRDLMQYLLGRADLETYYDHDFEGGIVTAETARPALFRTENEEQEEAACGEEREDGGE